MLCRDVKYSICFICMQFSKKNWANSRLAPLWVWRPPFPQRSSGSTRVIRSALIFVQDTLRRVNQKGKKYQGVKEFHMLARIGCCNIMVFSPFKVKVTYYHPLNQWLLGATNGNQGQTVMHLQCSETINRI